MNKNTEKALEFAVKKLVKTLENTTNFVLEQAPDVLKEMVTEAKIGAAFAISASSIALIVCLTTMYYFIPKSLENPQIGHYSDNTGYGFISVFASSGAIACTAFIVCSIYGLVVLNKCPKLFLLRQLKELVSSSEE